MSGGKTRFGFSGGDEPPPSDAEGAPSPRAARTTIGRAIHVYAPSDPRPVVSLPPTPREAPPARVPPTPRGEAVGGVPEPVTDETTEELPLRPSHTGKSRFPALARLFGRWTTGGGFHSRSLMSGHDDDLLNVPRDPWISRVAIFAVAGLLSFVVALLVLKAHQCGTSAIEPSAEEQRSVPPAAAAPAAPVPAPPAPPAPPAAASQPAATAPAVPISQPPPDPPRAAHQPATKAGGSHAPPAPGATGKLRSQSARPGPPPPATRPANRDGLLPLKI